MNEEEYLEQLFLLYWATTMKHGIEAADKALMAILQSAQNHSPGPHCVDCPGFEDCEMYAEWKNGLQ